MSPALSRTLTYGAIAVAAALAGVLVAAVLKPAAHAPKSGVVLDRPRPLADFALLDHHGKAFGPQEFRGRWTVLFAGFTHCPDVCPTTLQTLKAVEDRLGADADRVRTVLLTVDPERDTPDVMARYVGHFSPRFVGLTGPLGEIDKLCGSLGLAYGKVPGATAGDYTMDHTAALVLLNPDAQVHGYFTPPFDVDALATDLAAIVRRAS